MGRLTPVSTIHLAGLEQGQADVGRGAAEHVGQDDHAVALLHALDGAFQVGQERGHVHRPFDGDVCALLLRPQDGLGRFQQMLAELAMGHQDHSNHFSSNRIRD
jgi:hypothetical protein